MTEIIQLALITATPPTIFSIAALIVSIRNTSKVEELHLAVNSRLSELILATAQSSRSAGMLEQQRIHKEETKPSCPPPSGSNP